MFERPIRTRTGLSTLIAILLTATAFAQSPPKESVTTPISRSAQAGRVRFVRGFVIDERLSALRREPSIKSEVRQRLRLGRPVYIIGASTATDQEPAFVRVAVTRRTRGWIHQLAVAVPGRKGDDQRVLSMIESVRDSLDRLALCKLFLDHFTRSPLAPQALLMLAEEADRAATSLGGRAHRRLDEAGGQRVSARDLYLNDSGLDRYSRLRVNFNYHEATGQYTYDGQAYRDILKRFPTSPEAARARARLAAGE